jgi:hypothetical protein
VLDETGTNRVREDVLHGALVVLVIPNRPRGESSPEDVAAAVVALVEALGVSAVQVLHAGREPVGRGLHDQVVMRAREAIRGLASGPGKWREVASLRGFSSYPWVTSRLAP